MDVWLVTIVLIMAITHHSKLAQLVFSTAVHLAVFIGKVYTITRFEMLTKSSYLVLFHLPEGGISGAIFLGFMAMPPGITQS